MKNAFPIKKTFIRIKPTISVKKTKFGFDIIKTVYDGMGKAVQKQVESVKK